MRILPQALSHQELPDNPQEPAASRLQWHAQETAQDDGHQERLEPTAPSTLAMNIAQPSERSARDRDDLENKKGLANHCPVSLDGNVPYVTPVTAAGQQHATPILNEPRQQFYPTI